MSDGKFRFLDRDVGLPYLWGRITAFFVKKEDGKGLSTNDFTTEEKTKLEGLQNYTLPKAQKDVLGGIKVGAGLAIDDDGNLSATGGGEADSVNWDNVVGKPTNVSEFANDAGYQTATQVDSAITSKGYQPRDRWKQLSPKRDIRRPLKWNRPSHPKDMPLRHPLTVSWKTMR